MRKLYSLLIIICFFTSVSYAQTVGSEAYYKKLILANYDIDDPIVGIYTDGGYADMYQKGKLVHHLVTPPEKKVLIIRNGDCYTVVSLPASIDKADECDLIATANPNVFIDQKDGVKMKLSDGMLIKTAEKSTKEISDGMGISQSEVSSQGIKIFLTIEYTKIFPTYRDIEKLKNNKISTN